MKIKMKKQICGLLAVLSSFMVLTLQPTAFDDSAAQVYADKYVTKYNSSYKSYSADCTNFVSQCLAAGGLAQTDNWWYKKGVVGTLFDTHSHAWSVADDLKNYMKNDLKAERMVGQWKKREAFDSNGKRLCYAYRDNSANILGYHAEVIFYDWQDDGHIDHASFVVGTNTAYDGTGYGDLINQHTTNRQHTVWHLDDYNTSRDTTAIYGFRLDRNKY
ncbi:MAG: hypothetical protein HFE78_00625 [Clostridiales bacterium]|nr:hypothetical protein [Clostridiales bacterium]